jgi:methylase of polypeptide subunit release factors
VLELCAGAGQIGLLAVAEGDRELVLVDLDPAACAYAHSNARRVGLADRVVVRQAALHEAVEPGERFAVVIADPPWVPSGAIGRFPEDPLLAIDGGPDGLATAWTRLEVAAAHVVGAARPSFSWARRLRSPRCVTASTTAHSAWSSPRAGPTGRAACSSTSAGPGAPIRASDDRV